MKIELAKSLSGHDKNHIYLIWKKDDKFAWLVNGRTHSIENPKKKSEKHYQIIKNIPQNVLVQINPSGTLTDEMIRRIVKEYERSINK